MYILSVFGYCIVVSLTAFSVICNKTFFKVYTLLSHTPHHTKSPLGSRGRDKVFEVQSFSLDTGPQSFWHFFVALSVMHCLKSAQKCHVQLFQVATVVMETTQLVPGQFNNFLL